MITAPDLETRRTVNISQAATLAGVSVRTIYNWLHAGKLEYARTAGGAVRIVAETLFRPGVARPPPLG
jgi:excisionase family DNA binding protein